MPDEITVELVFARADQQTLVTLSVRDGTLLADAVTASGVLDRYPRDARSDLSFGIWGRVVASNYRLCDGDRIEIYRPLVIDPRAARRRLAEVGRTMGKTRAD